MNATEIKKRMEKVNTPEQAEELAVEWQTSFNSKSKYWSEVFEEAELLAGLAAKFNLTEEFEENGIL